MINPKNKKNDICNTKRWKDKLDVEIVTELQVKECLRRLHSKYIDSHNADHLSRLKLGKTHFNAELHHHNQSDDPYCNYCKVNFGQKNQEDYKHALFHCPGIQKRIKGIESTFFRDTSPENSFNISDILI